MAVTYRISNGIRHGERKTLEGAKALAAKFQRTCNNRVRIDKIYYDEETQNWKCENVQ